MSHKKPLQKVELTDIGKGEEPKLEPRILIENPECSYSHIVKIFKIPAAVGEPTHFKKIPYTRFDSSLTDLRNSPHHINSIKKGAPLSKH